MFFFLDCKLFDALMREFEKLNLTVYSELKVQYNYQILDIFFEYSTFKVTPSVVTFPKVLIQ